MLDVNSFDSPEKHPFGMLRGYDHAMEKEQTLVWILQQCIDAGDWMAVRTMHRHPTMVTDGLLHQYGERYSLTEKAKGLCMFTITKTSNNILQELEENLRQVIRFKPVMICFDEKGRVHILVSRPSTILQGHSDEEITDPIEALTEVLSEILDKDDF